MSNYTDADIQKCLDDMYDQVIAIQSVRKLKLGWKIYGRRKKTLCKVYGRLVALLGDANAGKTFLIRKFNRDQIKLPGSHIVHTPGLCMILPEDAALEESTDPRVEQKQEIDKSQLSERELLELLEQEELNQEIVPDAPKNVINGVIYLDTQGTNYPCSDADLTDVRATEFLLRQLTLEIATRVIYVTPKFTRDTQVQIGNLIRQLDNTEKPVTPTNRLLIVHNWAHVNTLEELAKLIEEVKRTYTFEAPEQDERFKRMISWLPEPFMGTTIYNGRRTIHFFLGNDASMSEHNEEVIAAIEAKMYENNLPKEINLIQQVMDRANRLVERMIKDWDHSLVLDEEDGKPLIILPKPNNPGQGPKGHFTLHNMQFLGYTIVSEGISNLFGRVDIKDGEMRVQIHCAGITQEYIAKNHIQCEWDINNQYVIIKVQIPPEEGMDGWEQLQNTVKVGTGMFIAQLPEDQRLLRFVRPRRDEIPTLFLVKDGVLEFKLQLADNIND